MKPLVSIVIPLKKISDYLYQETIPAILSQTYTNFEIIVLPDRRVRQKFPRTKIIPTWPKTGPADKRDLGVKKARGEVIAFLDDDSYPEKDWLEKALKVFNSGGKIAAVCGPSLTPPSDNLYQKTSGWVWSSWLGSGGAGTYRCALAPRREVDDFPTVNLLVRKKDFLAVGGFDSAYWPGEDTKHCHDLVYKLGKKIIYDPQVLVYHHRRAVFGPHLRQISRYALHRGHFVRILPRTSFRLGYFVPTLFTFGLILGLPLTWIFAYFNFADLGFFFSLIWTLAVSLYLFLLLLTAGKVFLKERNLCLALLVVPSILATHLVYGVLFVEGFLTPRLKSKYQ